MLDTSSYDGLDEEQKFEQLFLLFHAPLLKYARGHIDRESVCEDIVQDVFVSLWERREALPTIRYARSYLAVAVRNRCFNWLKKRANAHKYTDFVRNTDPGMDDPAVSLVDELYEKLEGVLARLPESYRTIFEMHNVERKPLNDIAVALGVSLRTAKRHNSAMKRTLQEEMKEYLSDTSLVALFGYVVDTLLY